METTVYNAQGKEAGKIDLPSVFETKISKALLHEVVVGYLANQRSGTHSTKTRGEVSGGAHKPWKQKGTGNARAGSIRSPLWRKGGIIFGPKPRSYVQGLSQQKRQLSLQMALASKAQDGNIMVLDGFSIAEPKTKNVYEILKNLNVTEAKNLLLVVDKTNANIKTAARNIDGLVVAEAKNLNTYQVMWATKVLLTKASVEAIGVRQA
jgi:large subunit ribosomal protein L4